MPVNEDEKRTWPRIPAAVPISIRCESETTESAAWYVGKSVDVSVDGMSVNIDPLPKVPIGSRVTLFCWPNDTHVLNGLLDAEPVWIKGWITSLDPKGKRMGIKIQP